jgi:hypothetical protein
MRSSTFSERLRLVITSGWVATAIVVPSAGCQNAGLFGFGGSHRVPPPPTGGYVIPGVTDPGYQTPMAAPNGQYNTSTQPTTSAASLAANPPRGLNAPLSNSMDAPSAVVPAAAWQEANTAPPRMRGDGDRLRPIDLTPSDRGASAPPASPYGNVGAVSTADANLNWRAPAPR